MKKALTTGVLALGLALSSFATPASAASINSTGTAYEELVAHFQEDGVPASDQKALAEKTLSGAVLDSTVPGKKPVESKKWSDPKTDYLRETFADGSYRITSYEQGFRAPKGVAVPAAISGCIVTTGTGYQQNQNCRVSESQATFKASFVASYTFSAGVYGSISKVTDGNVKGFGGTVKDTSIVTKLQKKRSDGRVPASAYVKWYFKSKGELASGTTYLYLKVTAKKAYTEVD
ncbi:hypothetical protein [Glutamicibacter sp. JC586]|uniref:hypothetical protein n=1 Tax=Glutamicibacter sp. JC586 TaxID=2590552 RepID=UPI001358EBFC|nr:hypothetical protein [Glutamicibacter sp. JC586]